MKIITIVGARPQFVKAAPVSAAILKGGLDELIIHTGQHYDHLLSQVFFDELGIPAPAFDLGVGSGSHAAQTAEMLVGIENILTDEKPDAVLLYGDTNSTLSGALAASKLHIPVAHVEAGLRSFNRRMPEEINRVMTDHLSSLLFCPTKAAVSHLASEGVREGVFHCGDVMLDSARLFGPLAEKNSTKVSELELKEGSFALVTIHRAENTDCKERLSEIFQGIKQLAEEMPVVLPLHPRTRAALDSAGLFDRLGSVIVIDPLPFLDMIQMIRSSRVIVTDSGGVQKEAYFHGRPCVTIRDETEWVETVEAGWNCLVPASSGEIVSRVIEAVPGVNAIEEYGSGDASAKIVSALQDYLS